MFITLSEMDLASLSPPAQQEVAKLVEARLKAALTQSHVAAVAPQAFAGFDMQDVVNFTPAQVEEFISGCSPETIAGLKVIAEHGPIIRASLLNAAGISNYAHFQGRVTKRTRTVTQNRHAFLMGWDNWSSEENKEVGCGHYAVTTITHQSLRKHFGLD